MPTPLCLPVAGGNPAGALTGACWCPRSSHMPPPHPCTHSCVPAHLVTLGRPSADALLPPCSSSRPGHRRAAYSALALIQRRLGRRQRRPPQHPASSCDEYFEDAGLSTQFNTPGGPQTSPQPYCRIAAGLITRAPKRNDRDRWWARAHRADQNPDIKSGAEGGAPARLQPRRLELRPSPLAQAAPLPLSSA